VHSPRTLWPEFLNAPGGRFHRLPGNAVVVAVVAHATLHRAVSGVEPDTHGRVVDAINDLAHRGQVLAGVGRGVPARNLQSAG